MSSVILAAGLYNAAFGVFHLFFWRLFDWKTDLARLTPLNRSIVQVLNLCLTLVLFIMALVCLNHPEELASTALGGTLLGGFALFWLLRSLEQVVFFGLRHRLSAALAVLFVVGSALHLLPLID